MGIATESGHMPTQIALAWTLLNPAVSMTLLGARTLEQGDEEPVRGAIHLLHSSYTPIASLLETTEQVLRVAVS